MILLSLFHNMFHNVKPKVPHLTLIVIIIIIIIIIIISITYHYYG